MKFLTLLFCSAAMVAADYKGITKCPELSGKNPFDADKFGGVWHMISYMPTGFPEEQCSRMNVSASRTENATIMDYQLLYKLDGQHKIDMLHSVAENEKASESFAVFKEQGSDQWSGPYKKYIVATDYLTYAITISCRQVFNAEKFQMERSMCAHVYSRDTCLPQNTLDTLHSIMSGYGIEYNSFKIVDHTGC